MKKRLALILALMLLFTAGAFADTVIPYDSMTAEELAQAAREVSARLNRLAAAAPDNRVLFDADGIRISMERVEYQQQNDKLIIYCLVQNDTDTQIGFSAEGMVINAWTMDTTMHSATTEPLSGNKTCYIGVNRLSGYSEGIDSPEQITACTLYLRIWRMIDGKKVYTQPDPLTLVYNAAEECFLVCGR